MNRRKLAGACIPLLALAIVSGGCGGGNSSSSPVAPVEDTSAQVETPPMPPTPQDELVPPSGDAPPDPGADHGDPTEIGG